MIYALYLRHFRINAHVSRSTAMYALQHGRELVWSNNTVTTMPIHPGETSQFFVMTICGCGEIT